MSFVRTGLFVASAVILATLPASADAPIRVELNAAEGAAGRCRLSFVVENASTTAVEALKLDLAIFGRDGAIQRRLLTEMGPVRAQKTVVRTFEVESDCAGIGSVLVNDVTACAPATLGDCLDRLNLSSRLADLRLFK
ncbi:MAG: hypothetical protein ACHQAY_02770 [Hyphomicrobiales bacterium]